MGQAKFCFPELRTPLATWELTFYCKSSSPSLLPYSPRTDQPKDPSTGELPGSLTPPHAPTGSSIPRGGPPPWAFPTPHDLLGRGTGGFPPGRLGACVQAAGPESGTLCTPRGDAVGGGELGGGGPHGRRDRTALSLWTPGTPRTGPSAGPGQPPPKMVGPTVGRPRGEAGPKC